ncbi:carboxypeptidase M32 [Prochlorococcus sp. SS52]|uniref:carboxypeptidase M32 n=1 Tax=Prochlorococcus sp. SS52 TaxID=1499501 RepID=UPI000533AC16|nr:carboxypeptidase M32 [Prochlorococcus sp. SS52]KGG36813.1 Thermostable carboxypeptidase 1 [Prochlorococcus sp. SS52]
MTNNALNKLGRYLRETQLLGSIHSTLYWDQNTTMPAGAASWRGEQLGLLAKVLHARQSSDEFDDLIKEAKEELQIQSVIDQKDALQKGRNIELLEIELSRQKKLDSKLVVEIATAQTDGYALWQEAKTKNDYKRFAPALKKLITLRQKQAKQLDEPRSCWETLAQPYEPDLTIKRLNELFDPLRTRLPELVNKAKTASSKNTINWDLTERSQLKLCERLLNKWGRDKHITCLGRSPHPFSITLGPQDFRLTTRVVPEQPFSCFLATAHEWGHSLYEQGLPSQSHQWFAWPLGQATSMAVHESQSLFWENRVARSRAFSDSFWVNFSNEGAPVQSGLDLWRSINPLVPGLNRVEADEVSYGIHILIRTDLEIALLQDGLEVWDLPNEWNKRYKELLGVIPKNDSEGCLQDVHWSEGAFGYFPSYLLGHLISAQLSEAMSIALKEEGYRSDDPLGECILEGSEHKLLNWLRKEVHHHGRQVNAEQLVEKVTGRRLASNAFLNYLENKLEMLTSSS